MAALPLAPGKEARCGGGVRQSGALLAFCVSAALVSVIAGVCAAPLPTPLVVSTRRDGGGDHHASRTCDAVSFGAHPTANASSNARAINEAMASSACDIVVLSGAATFQSGSIRLVSNTTLWISAGTTLQAPAAGSGAIDTPDPNPWSQYQDFGHSHWKNSLIWAVNVSNVTVAGGGTIDGTGLLSGAPVPDGDGDKIFGLRSCQHVSIGNLSIYQSGHFAVLATDVDYLSLTDMDMRPTRDGLDIVSCRNVLVQRVFSRGGGDDACVLKSDFSTGQFLESYDIRVLDSSFSTNGATALEIGSETVGNFSDIVFDNITVYSAGDAGIGMAIMDGSNVRNVVYSNIVMSGVDSPFQFYIGSRLSHPGAGNPGSIRDVVIRDVVGFDMLNTKHGYPRNWTATFDGQPANSTIHVGSTFPVGPNISFSNVELTFKGGATQDVSHADPHHVYNHWFMVDDTRPSYAWFMRNTHGVSMTNMSISYEQPDSRACVVLENAADFVFSHFRCSRGGRQGYDIALRDNVENVQVVNSPGIVVKQV